MALLKGEMAKTADNENNAIDKLQEMKVNDGSKKSETNAATANAATRTMIIILLVAVVFAMGIGIFISRIIANPVKALAENAEKLAVGDVNVNVEATTTDEIGQLTNSFRTMVVSIQAMTSDVDMLTKEALDGKLDKRADASKHKGSYKEIIEGMNSLLEAVVNPLNEAFKVLETAARKDLTSRVEGSYKGQLASLKDNVNTTIAALDEALSQVSLRSSRPARSRRCRAASNRWHL